MTVLMICYQVLKLLFVIMDGVLAFWDKPHAYNYLVKEDDVILLVLNQNKLWKLT